MLAKYKKKEILSSIQFTGIQKDILTVLLQDNKTYSIEECQKLLKKEQRREIK